MSISRGTAPEQPVEWAHSSKMNKRIFTNFKTFYKFANFNELYNQSHEFSNYGNVMYE